MSQTAIRAGAAYVELGLRNKMEKGLNSASKRLRSFAAGVSGIGAGAVGVGLKIAAPLAIAASIFANFDSKMSAVKAITGATDAEMAVLRDTAKSLGASTQFSASQAADAMKFLGMAGYNTEQILAGIPAVLNLAAAGAIDLATAADIASDVSSAFGLTADEIGRVADVMASTATSSNTSIEMMGETFKYLAPLANAAGQSIEQAGAAVGIVANSGIKASMAGTDLALMMKTLADPAAQKQLKKLGVETVDTNGNIRDFTDIVRDLSAATSDMQEAEKLAFFERVFQRAAKSALILSGSTTDLDKLAEKLANAGGSAEKMAKTMQDNVMGDFTAMLSALEGVALEIGEALKKPLRSFIQEVTQVFATVGKWIKQNQGVAVTIAAVASILLAAGAALMAIALPIAAVGMMLSGMATMAGVAAASIGVVGSVLAAIVSPAGLVVAAVIAVGAAITHYSGAGVSAIKFLKDAWATLSTEVSNVSRGILAALNSGDLATIGKIISQSLVLYWRIAIGEMEKAWVQFSANAMNTLDSAFHGILDGSLIRYIGYRLAIVFTKILNSVLDAFISTFKSLLSYLGIEVTKIFDDARTSTANLIANSANDDSESRADQRKKTASERIAGIDAEIAALRAARDATIDTAVDAATQAAAKAAEEANKKALDDANNAASGAAVELKASALNTGTFSGYGIERAMRSANPIADAFKAVGTDIVDAVNGTTDAINSLEPATYGA